jgi:hypothetical protein
MGRPTDAGIRGDRGASHRDRVAGARRHARVGELSRSGGRRPRQQTSPPGGARGEGPPHEPRASHAALIRYELAESVVLAEGPDPSGRPWLRIARVDGRSDDVLTLPARGGGTVLVHPFRLRSPFARLSDVRGYQIVHRRDGLLLRVIPRAGAELDVIEKTRKAVAETLADVGAEIRVRVEIVSEIEREPRAAAKIKLVRSET